MSEWANRIVGEGVEEPSQLLANPHNFRIHPKVQQDALEAILDRVGWVQDIIVNRTTGHILDGHLRVELAERRGETVPVKYVEIAEDEERLILATFDPISALATTDDAVLRDLIGQIEVDDPVLEDLLAGLAGEDGDEREEEGQTDEDDVPPEPVTPITREGELWLLGDHRLVVGDALQPQTYRRLLAGEPAHCLWTDPPYNVDYEGSDGKKLRNDKMERGAFRRFLRDAFTAAIEHLAPGAPAYIAHADSEGENFRAAAREAGLNITQCLVWVKSSLVIGRQDYQWQHEPILYGWKPGAAHRWFGERNKSTVLDEDHDLQAMSKGELQQYARELREALATTVHREDKPRKNGDHPTMKPVRLITRHLKNSTRRGDIVLDPFGGSGSTLIACQKLGRAARLVELDPVYADVIIRRWQEFTGEAACREDGVPFEAVPEVNTA